MSYALINNIDQCSFLMDGNVVLFAKTPIGILNATHHEVRPQGSLMDSVGLPELRPTKAAPIQAKAIQAFLYRVDALRGEVNRAILWLEKNPGPPHPAIMGQDIIVGTDERYEAEKRAMTSTVGDYGFLLRKAPRPAETDAEMLADDKEAAHTVFTDPKSGTSIVVARDNTISFFHAGDKVWDGVSGKCVATGVTCDAFLASIGIQPAKGKMGQVKGLLPAWHEFIAKLVGTVAATGTPDAAADGDPNPSGNISPAAAWALLNDIPQPNAMLVTSSEEATAFAMHFQSVLDANPTIPGNIQSKAKGWVRGWKAISRTYSVEFATATANKPIPAAVLAKKAAKRERDANTRLRMQAKGK